MSFEVQILTADDGLKIRATQLGEALKKIEDPPNAHDLDMVALLFGYYKRTSHLRIHTQRVKDQPEQLEIRIEVNHDKAFMPHGVRSKFLSLAHCGSQDCGIEIEVADKPREHIKIGVREADFDNLLFLLEKGRVVLDLVLKLQTGNAADRLNVIKVMLKERRHGDELDRLYNRAAELIVELGVENPLVAVRECEEFLREIGGDPSYKDVSNSLYSGAVGFIDRIGVEDPLTAARVWIDIHRNAVKYSFNLSGDELAAAGGKAIGYIGRVVEQDEVEAASLIKAADRVFGYRIADLVTGISVLFKQVSLIEVCRGARESFSGTVKVMSVDRSEPTRGIAVAAVTYVAETDGAPQLCLLFFPQAAINSSGAATLQVQQGVELDPAELPEVLKNRHGYTFPPRRVFVATEVKLAGPGYGSASKGS